MSDKDPFGFSAATAGEERAAIDLDMFAPRAKAVDRHAAEAASSVAQGAGFSRRTVVRVAEPPPPPARSARRRIPISQAVGYEDRYPDSERLQLNVLAPLPVAMRWREMMKSQNAPAWVLLEEAMDALAAQRADPTRSRG
jgi:hypothetical protein